MPVDQFSREYHQVVDLLSIIIGLPEARGPFEQKILQADSNALLSEYHGAVQAARNLGVDLGKRRESDPLTVRRIIDPVRAGTGQIQSLKNSLASVDSRIRKVLSTKANLVQFLDAVNSLEKAQNENDPVATEKARTEVMLARERTQPDLAKLYPDVKASLRYRLQFLRTWKGAATVQLNLCDLLIACLTQAVREKAGLLNDDDRQIRELIERGGTITTHSGFSITLSDLIPDTAEEIRESIGGESEEAEQLIQQRNKLRGIISEMEEAERNLDREISEQRVMLKEMSDTLRTVEECKPEEKASRRMVIQERLERRNPRNEC